MLDKMYLKELGETNGKELNTDSDSFDSEDDDLSENLEDREERKKQMKIRNQQRKQETENKLTDIARLALQNLGQKTQVPQIEEMLR